MNELLAGIADAHGGVDRMLTLYPNLINPGSLWGSANAAKRTPQVRA